MIWHGCGCVCWGEGTAVGVAGEGEESATFVGYEAEEATGRHPNWRRGETREGAAQKGTTGIQEERLKGPGGGSLAPRP